MEQSDALKRTPLYNTHLALNARMMPFAGFSMPVQYRVIVEEHLAVRKAAGLFDVSHMGEVFVSGPQAADFLQWLVTNDVSTLYPGRAMYTVMCREDGGIVDDLLVYCLSDARYMLVINAANTEKDITWMRGHADRFEVALEDASDRIALLALQGPATRTIVDRLHVNPPVDDLKYYHFREGVRLAEQETMVLSRTGYTGEYGIEIYCELDQAPGLWEAIMDAGVDAGLLPAGLGARDTLRLEAGMALYGNELDDETNPVEAGLSWVVKLNKNAFLGREALARIAQEGPVRKLVGFEMDERGIPRHGYELVMGDRVVGHVTSGTQSPLLGRGIGMGYIVNEPPLHEENVPVGVRVRGRVLAAHIVRPPFYKK